MNDGDRTIINTSHTNSPNWHSGLNRREEILYTNPQATFNKENGFCSVNKHNKYNEQEVAHYLKKKIIRSSLVDCINAKEHFQVF